ncbi:hypothetical protein AKO1_012105 [Acrasis kona]|uniref:Uncharacterized protein n=1 Tax=Acrasis kona TaxID=1008807 RepID=A0AAW2ZCN3_9EUKA
MHSNLIFISCVLAVAYAYTGLGLEVGLGIGHNIFTRSSGSGYFYKFDRTCNTVNILNDHARVVGSMNLPFKPASASCHSDGLTIVSGARDGAGILASVDFDRGNILNSIAAPFGSMIHTIHENVIYMGMANGENTCFTRYNLHTLSPITGSVCYSGRARIAGVLGNSKSMIIHSSSVHGFGMLNMETFTSRPSIAETRGMPVHVGDNYVVGLDNNVFTRYEISMRGAVASTRQISLGSRAGLGLGLATQSAHNGAVHGRRNNIVALNRDICNPQMLNVFAPTTTGDLGMHRINCDDFTMANDPMSISTSLLGSMDIRHDSNFAMNTFTSGNTIMMCNRMGNMYSLNLSKGHLYSNGHVQTTALGTLEGRMTCRR